MDFTVGKKVMYGGQEWEIRKKNPGAGQFEGKQLIAQGHAARYANEDELSEVPEKKEEKESSVGNLSGTAVPTNAGKERKEFTGHGVLGDSTKKPVAKKTTSKKRGKYSKRAKK